MSVERWKWNSVPRMLALLLQHNGPDQRDMLFSNGTPYRSPDQDNPWKQSQPEGDVDATVTGRIGAPRSFDIELPIENPFSVDFLF